MTDFDLAALLVDVDGDAAADLATMPAVVDKGDALDLDDLKIDKREWHRLDEAVAVVADLKSSTRIGLNKKPASVASIYQASTGGVVQILAEFGVDFVAIQGDGVVGLFWGDKRMERGVCAGITIKTFSQRHLVPRLEKKWPRTSPRPASRSASPSARCWSRRSGSYAASTRSRCGPGAPSTTPRRPLSTRTGTR